MAAIRKAGANAPALSIKGVMKMLSGFFLNSKQIDCANGEICMGYKHYLHSRHWETMRLLHLPKDSKCQMCGEIRSLQLHHVTYKNIGREKAADFISLCDNCHKIAHKIDGNLPKYTIDKPKKSKPKSKKPPKSCYVCYYSTTVKCSGKQTPYCNYTAQVNPKLCDKFKYKRRYC